MLPVLNARPQCGWTVRETLTVSGLSYAPCPAVKTSASVYTPGNRSWLCTMACIKFVERGITMPEVRSVVNQLILEPGEGVNESWLVNGVLLVSDQYKGCEPGLFTIKNCALGSAPPSTAVYERTT